MTTNQVTEELRRTARCLGRLAVKVRKTVDRYSHDPAGQERLKSHAWGLQEAAGVVRERATKIERRDRQDRR